MFGIYMTHCYALFILTYHVREKPSIKNNINRTGVSKEISKMCMSD